MSRDSVDYGRDIHGNGIDHDIFGHGPTIFTVYQTKRTFTEIIPIFGKMRSQTNLKRFLWKDDKMSFWGKTLKGAGTIACLPIYIYSVAFDELTGKNVSQNVDKGLSKVIDGLGSFGDNHGIILTRTVVKTAATIVGADISNHFSNHNDT